VRLGDDFVLKPEHSAFFATPREILLDHLRAERLIVPSGCIASLTPARALRPGRAG
jgi:hypothetical protein